MAQSAILKKVLDSNDTEGFQWAAIPAHLNLLQYSNLRDSLETDLPDVWRDNVKVNLDWIKANNNRVSGSVWDLPKYKNKAIIFVGASPILKKQWKALKQVDDRFVIVSMNSSAEFLINKGIIPNYVIYVDGKTSPDWTLDLGNKTKDITLIASLCAAPEVLHAWQGPILILPYKIIKAPKLNKRIKYHWKKFVPGGGNAFNAAVIAFMLATEAKILIFAGNELSWKRQYYVHRKSTNDDSPYYFARDVNKQRVRTNVALYNYKVWLEHVMAMAYPEYVFFNCSEGILGVDVDGDLHRYVYQEKLLEAIELTKGAFGFEKLPWEEQNRLIYEDAYRELEYKATASQILWPHILSEIPFTKALDVGCGHGKGIAIARKQGKEVWGTDIADASKFWKKNGVNDYCQVAPGHKLPYPDNSFDLIVCTEVMEHIPIDGVDPTLKEIFRVGSDKFLFSISLTEDIQQMTTGYGYHITIRPAEWWMDKFIEHGYQPGQYGSTKKHRALETESFFMLAVKDISQYKRGEKNLVFGNELLDINKERFTGEHSGHQVN